VGERESTSGDGIANRQNMEYPEIPNKENGAPKMHVCMLAYSYYETDNRVRRYTETLLQQGHSVDVISVRTPSQGLFGSARNLRVFRVQRRSPNEKARITYLLKLLLFSLKSLIVISFLHLRKRYDLVHVHNVPDFLVFSALFPKLTGAKIILDIHDILPELYLSKFGAGSKSLAYRALTFLEKLSAMWSDHVIVANHIWHSRYVGRTAKAGKCTVIMNYPNDQIFFPRGNNSESPVFTFIYPGTLSWHQGLDIAVEAFALLCKKTDKCRFEIYGHGPTKQDLLALIDKLGMQDRIHIRDMVPRSKVASVMAKADCGVVPKRSDGFADEAFSTKTWEFMALGVPIIVPATTVDRYYFDDSRVLFFKPQDVQDLADKMELMMADSDLRKRLASRGLMFSRNNTWNKKKVIYSDVIQSLFECPPCEQRRCA
jgi:glycosyltransferase involved in cell wall biosynthesis